MISVSGEYLVNIIERHVAVTIRRRRGCCDGNDLATDWPVSNEEVADFLLSIPYFDEGIKNFILGNSTEKTMIVSQAWEIAFILRTKKWAESECWLQKSQVVSGGIYRNESGDFLKLPY